MQNLNKQNIKNVLIELYDNLENITSPLIGPACDDDESADVRAAVLSKVYSLADELKKQIYNLH